jgi:tRNA G10  N-methylase Trm11
MKVHFRDKYLKKKGILDIAAELEESLAEEEFTFSNMNVREEKYIQMLCNDADERERIREFLLKKETTLVIEAEGKRFFGKFANKDEKLKFKEAQKNADKKFDL